MSDLGEYAKMKVADLRKILKSQGLSVTGNKTELIERLQTQSATGNGLIESSNVGEDEEFDEEAILGDEEDIDLDKISPHEEESVLLGTNPASMETGKKKITLKRSEPCLSVAQVEEAAVENTEISTVEEITPPDKKIKLSTEPEEPVQLESKPNKIKLNLTESVEARKLARLARFGITASQNTTTTASNNKLVKGEPIDVEKLKKRAERFGEVTSKSLVKAESTEKLKQRQDRFGEDNTEVVASKPTNSELEAKKAARAIRFTST